MGRRRLLTLLALAAAAAVVLAWGFLRRGDEGPALSHAQFVSRVDAVCGRLSRRNLALEPPPRPYDEQAVAFFDGVEANVRAARERLDELQPPERDAAALDAYTGVLRQIAVKLEQASAAASVQQDPEVATLVVEVRALTREAIAQERALGACKGRSSTRTGIAAVVKRTRENPLTETGPLVP
jgi:hypothetical protein